MNLGWSKLRDLPGRFSKVPRAVTVARARQCTRPG